MSTMSFYFRKLMLDMQFWRSQRNVDLVLLHAGIFSVLGDAFALVLTCLL
jgi:hypothetical protein